MSYLSDLVKDPVKECKVYIEKGCAHVDEILCNIPECKMLKDMENETKKAYVIIEYFGCFDSSYQKVYGVTLDKVKAEILKTESIESHKKMPESELPMTWEKFGELEQIYDEKLEEFNNDEIALFASGWCFDDCTMEDFYMMADLYDDYFYDDFVMTNIVETNLY